MPGFRPGKGSLMKKLDRKATKLNLQTETIQQLTQKQLGQVGGGAMVNKTNTCGCIDTAFACVAG
jgi:hypothetical protein